MPKQYIDIRSIHALTQNKATSHRLIADCKKRYPDRPMTWIVEKVVSEIYRDRGVQSKYRAKLVGTNTSTSSEVPWFKQIVSIQREVLFGLILAALFLGWNAHTVYLTFQTEASPQTEPRNRINP